MKSLTKRGNKYTFDHVIGGRRIRAALGVSDPKTASRLANRVQFALADGPKSPVWSELRQVLPPASFKRLTDGVLPPEPMNLTAYEQRFLDHISLRVKLGEISAGTKLNYDRVTKTFFDWALGRGLVRIDELTSDVVSEYCLGRQQSIRDKGGSGRGLITETTVLSMLFDFAIEEGWLAKTPLKYKPKIDAEAEEVLPFSEEEVQIMDKLLKPPTELLAYTIFRDTGLRCSDVANLLWSAVDWKTRTLKWVTAKRGKRVEVPLSRELYKVLDDAHIPGYSGRIFADGTASKLYRIIRNLGERAGVENSHPHRFRHAFACALLARGASLFDVASLLGDTHQVVAKHYAKWTNGQADRVRKLMEDPSQNEELMVA